MKLYLTVLFASILSACSGFPESKIVTGPLAAAPIARPENLERINSGSIFQPNMASVSLFSGDRKPRYVGDTLKINISENLNATSTVNTDTSKATGISAKGPGAKAGVGIFSSIFNLDATASGSNTFKGDGTTQNSNVFTGQVAATVINVLPNGNLVVAGDRTISLNGGVNVLRFSGIVNPRDVQAGNIVASADTVNARIEVVGKGDVSDSSQRNWIQRVLADSLSFW
jgi:flagellar L-ring protein precursor FlgH